jgi:alpha-1,4-digalacturonate transport system substrate-binding protein
MRKFALLVVLVMAAMLTFGAAAQDVVELNITWYDDGNEGAVLRDLLDRFEEANPDIKVNLNTVAYNVILEQLPSQVQAGEAPDIARITQFQSLVGYYLDMRPYLADAESFEANFPAVVLGATRAADDDSGLYGFPTQFTVTGPYINRTLFEQAGVDVPSDSMDAVTWPEWIAAATAVAEATETPYAIAFDRTGHRFSGPAISSGATFVNEDGSITIDSPGFRTFAEELKSWHDSGITPAEVWLGSGGSYAAAADYFINGQTVMYMAGSWQVGNFSTNIADAFDWEAIPNPTGDGGSTGLPGGAMLMAMAGTEHPEEVSRLMEYIASPEVYAEFSARTLFLPGELNLPDFEYDTDNESAAAALSVFRAEVPKIADEAFLLQYNPLFPVVNVEIRERLTQYMLGELTLDEAIARIQQAVDEAAAAAAQG